jgi:hypothetical protein
VKKVKLIYQGLALLMILSFSGPSLVASTLIALNLDELVQQADAIFTGKVLDSTSFLDGGRIYTLHRVEVEEPIHGVAKGDVVEVITAGGRSYHFSQKVFGEAELEPEQSYLLFLEPDVRAESKQVVGMSQGALKVEVDTTTRVKTARPPAERTRLVRLGGEPGRRIVETAPWLDARRPLDTLIEEIKTTIARLK